MCGFAGVVGLGLETARPAVERMLAVLSARGPSDSGTRMIDRPGGAEPPVALAHARLAIIAPGPDGAQPMGADDALWLVYNGEIYNYEELREELQGHGIRFRGRSDTEVVLAAYRVWGAECRTRLHGMFALAVADARRGQVWLCRDRLGIKPLYVRRRPEGGVLFGSQVTALLACGQTLVPARLRPEAIESFLAQGYVAGPGTIVDGVEELEPGTDMTFDWTGALLSQRRWWSLASVANGDHAVARPAAVEATKAALQRAVRRHLVADVPLGVFLSSGVDSTVVALVAGRALAEPSQLSTMSLGLASAPELDESEDAAHIARELGTTHCVAKVGGAEARAELEAFFAAMDQPTADGFNTFLVARAARQAGLTVALSGLGGDELFGGYATFRAARLASRFASSRAALGPLPRHIARLAARGFPSRASLKLAALARRPLTVDQVYFLRRELFLDDERRLLLALPAGSDPSTGMPRLTLEELTRNIGPEAAAPDVEARVSMLELSTYMRGMLLRDADVFGMARALEIRVPLLDDELVACALALPGAFKRHDPRPKPLLIDAAGGRLPAAVGRKKRGFKMPWDEWLRGPLRDWARERIHAREVWSSAGIDTTAAIALFDRFGRKDPAVSATQILALATLSTFVASRRLGGA